MIAQQLDLNTTKQVVKVFKGELIRFAWLTKMIEFRVHVEEAKNEGRSIICRVLWCGIAHGSNFEISALVIWHPFPQNRLV